MGYGAILGKSSTTWTNDQIMSNTTAALFGLGSDAVPDDMLNALAHTGDLHVWKRTQNGQVDYPVSPNPNAYQEGSDGQPAGYTLGEVQSGSFRISPRANTAYWGTSDKVSVSDNGVVSLVEYRSLSLDYSVNMSSVEDDFKGKFCMLLNGTGIDTLPFAKDTIYYFPEDATFSVSDASWFVDKYQTVTGYAAIPADTTILYLGQIGEKAKTITGSYVGTGRINGTCKIVFPDTPKVVYIAQRGISGPVSGFLTPIPYFWGQNNLQISQYSGSNWNAATASVSGNTLSFTLQYNDLNDSQYTYDYYALC